MCLGLHVLDLLFRLLNEPDITRPGRLMYHNGQSASQNATPPISQNGAPPVEDFVAAQFSTGSDTVVQLACSWNLPAGRDAVIEARFYGEHGGVAFRNVDGSFYHFTAERYDGTTTQVLSEPPDNWGG